VPVISVLGNRITERVLQRWPGKPTTRLRKNWEDAMRLHDALFLSMTNGRPATRHRSDWSEKIREVMASKRVEEPWEEDSDIVMTNQ